MTEGYTYLAVSKLLWRTNASANTAGKARIVIRTEGTLTELVFEHALRVRMKAETSSENLATNPVEANAANVTSVTKSQHLIGKLNNLVTTDLKNITGARDFIWLG